MKDLYHNLSPAVSVPVLIRNGNAATSGTGVDLSGYEGAVVEFIGGTLTDGSLACTLEDSDVLGSGYVAVGAADCIDGIASVTLASTEDNLVEKIGYIGGKRFVRAVITQSGATTGGTYGANVIRGIPRHAPTPVNA